MDSDFKAAVWPEDTFPKEAANYKQCEICTEKSRVVWGEGNPSAPVMIVLDNPGAREDKDGNEYVCPTRQTLQKALRQAGFTPRDVYVTYLLKCRPVRRYHKEEVRAFSKPFLIRQIQTMRPRFLVCLGDVVVQVMFENKQTGVKDMRGSWHNMLGLPCIVSYHPLAVRRRPNLARLFMQDWDMLAKRLSDVDKGS